jgi:lysozyme family protein
MNFEQRLDELVGVEGGYVNDLADSGGETIWGIAVAVARAPGYTAAMLNRSKK